MTLIAYKRALRGPSREAMTLDGAQSHATHIAKSLNRNACKRALRGPSREAMTLDGAQSHATLLRSLEATRAVNNALIDIIEDLANLRPLNEVNNL